MNLLTAEENENWTALLAAVVAAFLVATGAGFFLERDVEQKKEGRRRVARQSRVKPDEPSIRQARWKLAGFASATLGKVSPQQRKAIKRMTPRVKKIVRDLYDALTIGRDQLKNVSRRSMSSQARRALHGKPLVPYALKRVQTMKREARIAIDLRTRGSAAAEVRLTFKAERGKKRFKFVHAGTLWLERGKEDRWRVIAFDLDQRERA